MFGVVSTIGYLVAVAEPTSGRRDWAVWFQPRALEGRPEGVIFAALWVTGIWLARRHTPRPDAS